MKKNLFIITISVLIFSMAPQAWSANNKSITGEITSLTQWPSGLLVTLKTTIVNPAGCVSGSKGQYVLTDTDANAEELDYMKAMLLGAKLSGAKITLAIYGGGCFNQRAMIVATGLR